MFERGISKDTQRSLEILGGKDFVIPFYLAGGTALALHLGHRLSFDLDFFTKDDFHVDYLIEQLKVLGNVRLEQKSEFTFNGQLNGTKISFFRYPYSLIVKPVMYLKTNIASVEDIACMKLDAISSRGTKRDFIDLYFICQRCFNLEKAFNLFRKKYKGTNYNEIHLVKSLTYFEDAEDDKMPTMHEKIDWNTVKGFFVKQVQKLF